MPRLESQLIMFRDGNQVRSNFKMSYFFGFFLVNIKIK